MPRASELQVPFGAVFFRKSNPPREDWERDYGVAAADGLNIFRHWFMWAAIERAPGKYDWDDYDRQMDLAAEHGIRTIIAELTHTVPDWALRKFAHARQLRPRWHAAPPRSWAPRPPPAASPTTAAAPGRSR